MTEPDGVPAGGEALTKAFWALFLITIVGWAGRFVSPFLTLFMTVEVGYSAAEAGLTMSLFGLGGIASVIMAGVAIDRFGAYLVLVLSLAGTGVVALLMAWTTSGAFIAVLVLLLGVFSQAMATAINALVAAVVPAASLRRAYSLVFIGINLGIAAGPIAAGFLAGISYRLIFVAEAALMTTAVCIAVLLIPRASRGGATTRLPLTLRMVALGGLGAVVRDKIFMQFAIWNLIFVVIYLQSRYMLPLVMEDEGYTPAEFGLLLGFNGILGVIFQLPADRITRRVPQARLLAYGMAIVAIGFAAHAFAVSLWTYALCVVIWTAGELLNMPVASSVAARLAPEDLRGRYIGLFNISFSFASFVGPLLGGFVLDVGGSTTLWLTLGALGLFVAGARWRDVGKLGPRLGEKTD